MDNNKKNFKRKPFREREKDEFDQRIVDLRRVTRVMAGGKRMRFRACIVIGDGKGQIGYGLAKGKDVAIAVNKAVAQAKNSLLKLDIVDGTIAHQVNKKFKAAQVVFRPAPDGTGIIAGGAVRAVLELSGIKNVSAKILGSNNKVNIVKSVFAALSDLKKREPKQAPKPVAKPAVRSAAKPIAKKPALKKAKPAPAKVAPAVKK
ncbi:30S ribosomal protein S5 [Patescibacteria group bacterium]|nr:30S ribosomal protein S5 [Patescibacteria group bacterium]